MGKTFKIWLWAIIAVSILSIIGEFIFVNGMIGFAYACANFVVILAVVQILKSNKIGAYAFLGARIIETAMTFIFTSALIENSSLLITYLQNASINYVTLAFVIMAIRLVSPILTLFFCLRIKDEEE